MVWEDVDLMIDVGSVLKSVLNTNTMYYRLPSFSSPTPMDHDRMEVDDEDEEGFQVVGTKKEFNGFTGRDEVTFAPDGTSHLPALKNRSVGNKILEEEAIVFPTYDDAPRRNSRSEKLAILNSADSVDMDIPNMSQDTVDDTYLFHPPTRHVDYLSHDWLEEDIWASWRRTNSEKTTQTSNRRRLENASWRTWAKARAKLGTLPAQSINWIKDDDVTWLYGPLHTAKSWSPDSLSITDVQVGEGSPIPILKRPSLEQVLLQRSVSDISLLQHLPPAPSVTSTPTKTASPRPVMKNLNTFPPSRPRTTLVKSVSFHHEVAQCKAVHHERDESNVLMEGSISSSGSDSDHFTLKVTRPSPLRRCTTSLLTLKTIETLPPTTLKPAASDPQPKGTLERAKSWPSRTLSYLWNEEPSSPTGTETGTEPLTVSKESTTSVTKPIEKAIFAAAIDPEQEEEVHWNPPRPRKIPSTGQSSFPHAPRPPPASSTASPVIQPTPVPSTSLLTDDESFELEMFGFPSAPPPKATIATDEEVEMRSSRSSPSISEYLSSSSEDLLEEEVGDYTGLKFPVEDIYGAASPIDESVLRTPFGRDIEPTETKTIGKPVTPPRAESGITTTTFSSTRKYNFANFAAEHEEDEADESIWSPKVKKARTLDPSTSCASEARDLFGASGNFPVPSNSFAVQQPGLADAGATEDEEHWWMGV